MASKLEEAYWPIRMYLRQLPADYRLEGFWADPWPIKRGRWEPRWYISARMPNGQLVIYRNAKVR